MDYLLLLYLKINGGFRITDIDKGFFYSLEIERESISLTLEKKGKEKTSLADYDKAIMEPAIERVAGNHLKNIEDDKVFDVQLEELQRKYQNWYYATAYKYKLPTSHIIPFITK